MKFYILPFLALHALSSEAFTTSSSLASVRNLNRRLPVQYSSAVAKKKGYWEDLHEFNVELDRLAEQSGRFNQPVISKATECEEIWSKQSENTDGKIQPDTISFNTVLKAWNRCCNTLSESARSHKVLKSDFKHTANVYTPRDAAKRATTLLLEQEKGTGIRPDTASFNIVIDAWAKSRVDEAPEASERLLRLMLDSDEIEPDTLSYHAVLDAWANSGREESLGKVRQIYNHMENLEAEGKNVKPSIRTVNAILNTYAKLASKYSAMSSRDPEKGARCAKDAMSFFREVNDKYEETNNQVWMPDVTTYTSMMDVFSRVSNYERCKEAENLLQELKDRFKSTRDSRLRPNFRTYTTLITAWARSNANGAPERVEKLLDEMSEHASTKPNSRSYTSAIQCWGRSRDPEKATRALKILRRMQEEYKQTGNEDIRPSILSYNAAIDACARCLGELEQQTAAIKIAFAILKTIEIEDSVQPNYMTYPTLLRAIGNLLPPGDQRNTVAKTIFEKAKKGGLVEINSLKILKKTVNGEVMKEAMEGNVDKRGNFNMNELPRSWSRNIR